MYTNYVNSLFTTRIINKPIKHKQSFDSCSLLNSLSNLFKIFPKNFEISTNNGKYYFNKELICLIIPTISKVLNTDKDLNQFHINLDDELNIMKKIESLFKGESVDFYTSEEKDIKRITKLFENLIFSISLNQESQDKLTVTINYDLIFNLLQQNQLNTIKIKTNKNEYNCNFLGVFSSNLISSFLISNPKSNSYEFDYSDENSEFRLISNFFNFKEIKITSENIENIQKISEQLEIKPIIELIDEIYDKYDENLQNSKENQKIIDPYDELFERLFNIKRIGIEKVSEFILESDWVTSESDVQELVACLLHVIDANILIHQEILELCFLLSEKRDDFTDLSILISFLSTKMLQKLGENSSKNTISFIYHLYRKKVISIDTVLKKISLSFSNCCKRLMSMISYRYVSPRLLNIPNSIIWFYPELIERNFLNEKIRPVLEKEIPYVNSNTITFEQMKESRDNYVETDSIILALRDDDVDTFQSIVSTRGIDIQTKKIKMTIFDIFEGEISFIDYAAAYGSTKCFKYLYLNNASFNYNTFIASIFGGNVEIIRILDQNKNEFSLSSTNNINNRYIQSYYYQNPLIDVVNAAIKSHQYQIFDWLFDQNNFELEKELIILLKFSIECGNAHSMNEIIGKFSDLIKLDNRELYNLIGEACNHGFYKIIKFLTHLIPFHDLFDPTKGDHSDLKDISNRRIKIRILNSNAMKSITSFGMLSIFELMLNKTRINNSQCLFDGLIEAAKKNNLSIVKYILENNLYQLSPLFLIKLIRQSIENDSKEVTNYLFEKEVIVTTEILESACFSQNFELVKLLLQKADEKQIPLDFTGPFIKAVNPFSEDICRYFFDRKVTFNYLQILSSLNEIININPKIVILLIENIDDEIKDDILSQSLNAALFTKNSEILNYVFKKGINLNGLLLQAIQNSDLETVKSILEYNHSPEFINQIGPNGTALHVAVNNYKNDIVEYLLKLPGIDPSLSIDSYRTPLIEAVDLNNMKSVELILDFYGDSIKDQGIQIHNAFKQILLKQSRRTEENLRNPQNQNININNNNRIVIGANHMVPYYLESERLIFEKLLNVKEKLNPINMVENDLLSYAILEKDTYIVEKLLLMKSTNLKRKLQNGDSYLHLAINDSSSEITPIQKLLINHPDIDINLQNVLSETPLIKAVNNENVELIELILSHPKFDPKLSLLDYAFYLSTSSKNISRILLKQKSLDVNNKNSTNIQNQLFKVTPLMRAIQFNDIELVELIIHHPSFDPFKSKIKSCLFNSVCCKNLNLFRFLLKMNGNEINIKNDRNISLLCRAALIKDNDEILNEILNNENFDPIKSDIQTSFLRSNNKKAMDILISYDKKHGNYISLDKIELRIQSLYDSKKKILLKTESPIKSYQYLLRKKEIIPKIHPFCTLVLSKQSKLYQKLYQCKTCQIDGICEICAKVCHKGHEIQLINTKKPTSRDFCHCSLANHQCKCMSTQSCSDDEEIFDDFVSKEINNDDFDENFDSYQNRIRGLSNSSNNNININNNNKNLSDDNEYEYNDDNDDDDYNLIISKNNVDDVDNLSFDSLRCSLDLAKYQPIQQIMYHCKKCKVDICQNCAIRCHKKHPLEYKGIVSDSFCYCKDITDCKCTDRKSVVCSYLFYGTEYFVQPWFKCETCGTSGNRGCCALCSRHCHQGHKIHSDGMENAFCDCGANDMESICKCMKLPQFNHLTCCTNRNQNYEIMNQRMYHCFTCGITSKFQGICESCAIHCHVGHNVVFVGIHSFACECATVINYIRKFNCIASLCPELNYSGKCSRSNKNVDAVFRKFVCLTCDKEGKICFCEACAVKCHKSHDVHFVEFSNFECQCEHCKCLENDEKNMNQ